MESPVTFRVSQIPLYIYIKKGEDLSHQLSQLFFFYSKAHLFKTSEMAFRARKVIRTFEKRVPDQLKKTRLDRIAVNPCRKKKQSYSLVHNLDTSLIQYNNSCNDELSS